MRPKPEPNGFHVGIVGLNFDPVDLDTPENFIDFIHKNVREDLVFKKVFELSYWKSVIETPIPSIE